MGATMAPSGGGGGRRGGRRRRGGGAPMAEINITPFVDVMLVLLIIFMVAAPLLTVGVPVKLPETTAKQLPREKVTPLTVTVDADGRFYFENDQVSLQELPTLVREAMAERDSETVYIRGDREVAYRAVADVMVALNDNGIRKLGFVNDRARSEQ